MEIKLPCGTITLIDDEDYTKIKDYKWRLSTKGYVVAWPKMVNGKRKMLRLHRVILGVADNEIVDHIDRNKLNNKKENLRLCTVKDNNHNTPSRKGSSSKYKGVSKCLTRTKKVRWRASINVGDKFYSLGMYGSEERAALDFNEAAKKIHGEFAFINEIEGHKN